MSMNSVEKLQLTKLNGAAVAGTSDVVATAVLLANKDSGEIDVAFGACAGAGTILVEGSNDNSSFTTVDTIVYTTAQANKMAAIEVDLPNYKYIRVTVTRAGSNAIENIYFRGKPSRITPAPAGDANIRRIVAYAPNTLPNAAKIARTVS